MASSRRWSGMEFVLLTVFVLLAVFGLWRLRSSTKDLREVAVLAVRVAETSGPFKEKVGTPVRVGHFVSGQIHGVPDHLTAELKIPVSGPKGSGTLVGWMQGRMTGWQVCSLLFQPKSGPDLVIVQDVTANCERGITVH